MPDPTTPRPSETESEVASNGYLFGLLVLLGGAPLPLVVSLASFFYWRSQRHRSTFVDFHTFQNFLSHLVTGVANAIFLVYTVVLFIAGWEWDPWWAFVVTLTLGLNVYFSWATARGAVLARKGSSYDFGIVGPWARRVTGYSEGMEGYRHPTWVVVGLPLALILLVAVGSFAMSTFVLHGSWFSKGLGKARIVTDPVEKKLGEQFESAIAQDPKRLKDPVVDKAMAAIMARLTPAATNLAFPIKVHVIKNKEVNAFTFPGGVLVVYTGLLGRATGPEEVAAVIAHELGHVAGHDSIRALGAQIGITALMALATGGDPGVLADLVGNVMQIHYSKSVEAQADDYGLATLSRANLSPKHLATFFRRLDEASGPEKAWLKWLDGHPDLKSRREKAEKSAAEFDGKKEKPIPVNWAEVRARLPGMFD